MRYYVILFSLIICSGCTTSPSAVRTRPMPTQPVMHSTPPLPEEVVSDASMDLVAARQIEQTYVPEVLPPMPEKVEPQPVPRRSFNKNKIGDVHVNMTYNQVADLMGDEIFVGYSKIDPKSKSFEKLMMKNPYKTEVLSGKGQFFEVVYYITKIVTPDENVTEDELTPLVFQDRVLIGKDWEYLKKLQKQLRSE